MITHNLVQGTAEWHAYRAAHDNASDAPAMMGVSSYKTRDQLIAERATGIVPEVDAATQRLFDSGHRFEALARPLAEKILGEELYACTGSENETSRLSASFDGLTMLEDVAFEHKRLNKRLREALAMPGCTGADLPMEYQIQMEQQCAVSGCERVLFMASDWDDNDQLIEEMHCWYTPNLELRAQIIAGWEQFHKDVAAYVPPEAKPAPVTQKVVGSLPVVFDMRVEGKLVACNLEKYKPAALAYIAAINTELATDQDFADADADARFCRDSADKLELAIEQAMAQMGDINAAINTVREIAAAFDAKGLALEKLVKARKEDIKLAEVKRGQKALAEHIAALNAAMPADYMPTVPADFGAAVKNKRTVDSLRSAVNDELARAKIEASNIATRIHANVKTLEASGLVVPDAATLVLKAPDDLAAIIATRKAAEQQRQEAIRAEEAEKLQREQLAKQAEQSQKEMIQVAQAGMQAAAKIANVAQLPLGRFAEAAGPAVVPLRTAAPAERTGTPTLRIGTIKERLQHMSVTAEDLRALGFEPAGRERAAPLYHDDDFPAICEAIAAQALAAKAKFLRDLAVVAA